MGLIERALVLLAVVSGSATFYFFVFWTFFAFWRRHPVLTYAMMFGTLLGTAALAIVFRRYTFAGRVDVPLAVEILGGALMAAATILGTVADRQIGFRVRSFTPFFEEHGRIELRTTGAYAVVRHPIYASGWGFALGVALLTGYPSALIGALVFLLGATWFTRQEEQRLVALLDDPAAYERYRAGVPALFPRLWRTVPEIK